MKKALPIIILFLLLAGSFIYLYITRRQPKRCDFSQNDTPVIKANVNIKNERIYHIPGQIYYNATKIEKWKGEKMFCTEAEAKMSGFRRAKL